MCVYKHSAEISSTSHTLKFYRRCLSRLERERDLERDTDRRLLWVLPTLPKLCPPRLGRERDLERLRDTDTGTKAICRRGATLAALAGAHRIGHPYCLFLLVRLKSATHFACPWWRAHRNGMRGSSFPRAGDKQIGHECEADIYWGA